MKKSNRISYQKIQIGFTLIELIVIITIIGLLAVGVLTVLNPATQIQKARDAQRKSDLKQIQTALELYYQDTGAYPAADANIPYNATWGTNGSYMPKVPQDASSPSKKYYYVADNSNGPGYRLYAALDRTVDPQICNATTCPGSWPSWPSATSCGTACNYVVTSSNLSR